MPVLLITLLAVPARSAPHVSSAATFHTLLIDRIQAYGHGNVRSYMQLLADGFVHVSDLGVRRTKEQMPTFVGGHGDNHATYDIARLHWQVNGNLAIVDARVREHLTQMEAGWHESDIFWWNGRRWLYLRHQETAVWQQPVAASVAGDRLADYVGSYQTAAGTIDTITVAGPTLFDQTLPSKDRAPFVHVAHGAFAFADDPTLAVFLRDAAGNVTSCLWHLPSGQLLIARRLK